MSNKLYVIFPYKERGIWMFDDPEKSLVKEPLIAGTDVFLDMICGGKSRISVIFSDTKFPDYNFLLNKLEGDETTGTWYEVENYHLDGKPHQLWLCGALNLWYANSPEKLYLQFR